jgi:hypothetical protein
VTIAQTKRGGRAKIIPIDGELRDIYWRQLERRGNKEDGFFWPQTYFNPTPQFSKGIAPSWELTSNGETPSIF